MTFPLCTSSIFLKLSRRLSLWLRPKAAGCYIPQIHYLHVGAVDGCVWPKLGGGGGVGYLRKILKTNVQKHKQALCCTIRWVCSACSVCLSYKPELFMLQRNEIINHMPFDYWKAGTLNHSRKKRITYILMVPPIKQETQGLWAGILEICIIYRTSLSPGESKWTSNIPAPSHPSVAILRFRQLTHIV